jgi:hypothetical protein
MIPYIGDMAVEKRPWRDLKTVRTPGTFLLHKPSQRVTMETGEGNDITAKPAIIMA